VNLKTSEHAMAGATISILLVPLWGFVEAIFFFLGSWSIDSDHPLDFLVRSKFQKLNPFYVLKKTNEFCLAQIKSLPGLKNSLSFHLLHSVEFLMLIGATAFLIKSEILTGFFWGVVLHLVLDVIDARIKKIRKSWSLLWYLFKKCQMKKKGVDLDADLKKLFKEVIEKN
jgi:hypothetical protein